MHFTESHKGDSLPIYIQFRQIFYFRFRILGFKFLRARHRSFILNINKAAQRINSEKAVKFFE